MTVQPNTFDSHGAQIVGTLTRREWDEARAAADEVHVVQSEVSTSGWD